MPLGIPRNNPPRAGSPGLGTNGAKPGFPSGVHGFECDTTATRSRCHQLQDAAGIRARAGSRWRPVAVLSRKAGSLIPSVYATRRKLPAWTQYRERCSWWRGGRRYSRSFVIMQRFALELVLSGDDSMHGGRSASLGKRGYLVEPHRKARCGRFEAPTPWRRSFGPVRDVANRNMAIPHVGVLGFAISRAGARIQDQREGEPRLKPTFPARCANPPN